MRSIFNLILLAFIVIGIYFLVLSVPVTGKLISCYDHSVDTFDKVEVQSRTQGWSDQSRCELRQQNLVNLNLCLFEATSSAKYIDYSYPVIETTLKFIRPTISNLGKLISDHNEACAIYPKTQIILDSMNY